MNIAIVDDDKMKMENIKEYLLDIYSDDIVFYEFHSRNGCLKFIGEKPIDVLILDWVFPSFDDDIPEVDMGMEVLWELERQNLKIPTIICSSDEIYLTNREKRTYNVLGTIKYNSFLYQREEFEKLLEKIEE